MQVRSRAPGLMAPFQGKASVSTCMLTFMWMAIWKGAANSR